MFMRGEAAIATYGIDRSGGERSLDALEKFQEEEED